MHFFELDAFDPSLSRLYNKQNTNKRILTGHNKWTLQGMKTSIIYAIKHNKLRYSMGKKYVSCFTSAVYVILLLELIDYSRILQITCCLLKHYSESFVVYAFVKIGSESYAYLLYLNFLILHSGDVELNPGPKQVEIIHGNVNSLYAKIDIVRTCLVDSDILCFTESKLDVTIENAEIRTIWHLLT